MSCIPVSLRNRGIRLRSFMMPGTRIPRGSLRHFPADQNGGKGFTASPARCRTPPTSPRAVHFIPDVLMQSQPVPKNIRRCVISARDIWPAVPSCLKVEMNLTFYETINFSFLTILSLV